MSQVQTFDIDTVNVFTKGDLVETSDYGHRGYIREFGILKDNQQNQDWLSEQLKPWTDSDKMNPVVVIDCIPRGGAIVPISRVMIGN
jgi:hypothetical protein